MGVEISAKGVIPLEWRWMHLPRRSSCGDVDGSSEKVIPVERGKYLRRVSALGRMSKYPRRGPSLRCKGECIPEGGHPLKEVSLKGAGHPSITAVYLDSTFGQTGEAANPEK